MKKLNGGNSITECNPFKYGLFLCIYVVLFFCLYTTNLESNGFISLFFVNLLIGGLLSTDLPNIGSQSYNTHFYFYIVIIIGSLCNIISSFLIAITLFHLKLNYDTIQETIRYSPKNRKQLNNYKSLFVTNILSIFVLLIIIIYYTDNDIVIGKFKMDYLIKIIKYILSGLIVGISGYILYLSNSLSRMWSSKMKILRNDNEKNDYMKPIPQNSWRGYDITRYITPQYIMNFKWS